MPLLAGGKKDVLVVCPFPMSGTWALNSLEPIHMLENTRPDLRIWSAVMRNSSFRSESEYDEQAATIFNHYSAKKPDLIVIFGPGNYILAEDFDKKWPDVPMVLIGELSYVCTKAYVCDSVPKIATHRTPMKSLARGKNMTFIYSPVYMSETIDLICKNQPYVKNFYFIAGEEFVAREIELNMHKVAKAMGYNFTGVHPRDYDFRKLSTLAMNSNKNTTAFIYCNWHTKSDVRDNSLPYIGVRRALERSNLIYNIYYTIIDDECQTAGFVSYNHDELKNTLQSIVCAVIDRGEEPRNIPFVTISREKPTVNYPVLSRYGFDPRGHEQEWNIANLPPTFWEEYRVMALLLVVLALSGISVLFFFLYKKQKALWDSSERYYALVSNAPFNYNTSKLIFDENGELVDIEVQKSNFSYKQNMRILDLPSEKLGLMKKFPESAPRFIRHVADGISQKNKAVRFSHEMSEFGRFYEILVLFGREEDIVHIFSLDTTELMRTQKELQAAKERAEHSDQLKTMFVQNVSHEIRTPLNAVVGFSQLLSMPDDVVSPEEKEEYVKYIQNNSELLIMLVNDILSIGDVERGQFVVSISDVRVNDICQQSMRTAETRLPGGVNLYYTSDVDDDYTIKSDGHRIQQVLVNFLTNACKHTEKGEIHVHTSLSEKPGYITFSVTDTGTGVPADEAEHIFERFTKLNAFKQGAGLGLSICKNIATILKGDVHLDTSYTNGARFVFQLPLE
jgi:signal transduction histidine kinase